MNKQNLEKDKTNLFFQISTYRNLLQKYTPQLKNPFIVDINNINSYIYNTTSADNIDKNIILKKNSFITITTYNTEPGYYDFPINEIYIYSSASKSFDMMGNKNNIVGAFNAEFQAVDQQSALNNYFFTFTDQMDSKWRYTIKDDISLGSTCSNFYLGFLIRKSEKFDTTQIVYQSNDLKFLGDKYKEEYYWVNFLFGKEFTRNVGGQLFYNNTDINFNLNLDLINN